MSVSPFAPYAGCDVIIDTGTPHLTYLGRLQEITENAIVLRDADVHDMRDSKTPREVYVMESKKFGIKANRKEVRLRADQVVSMTRLDDIVIY